LKILNLNSFKLSLSIAFFGILKKCSLIFFQFICIKNTEEQLLKDIKANSNKLTPLIPHEAGSSSNIESNVEVSTLVEYPLSQTTSLTYYYPYFFKTHLITFSDEVDISILSTSCTNVGCGFCDPINPNICKKCLAGFFLYNDSCFSICPSGFITDILRMKCVPELTIEVVYSKAYSVGSCKNSCGKKQIDCECSTECKLKGNCCTDYDTVNCPAIIEKASKVHERACGKNINCQYCDDSIFLPDDYSVRKCNQCNDGFYLLEGRCLENCPENTISNKRNYICENKPKCNVSNCDECADNLLCRSCKKGFFKFGNSCIEKCPEGYRADRITWSCLEPPVFAWFWVYPSKGSCKNYCGVVIQEGWDCSCSSDCFLFGNCCQDVEYYCNELIFWRKNSKMAKRAILSNVEKKTQNKINQATVITEDLYKNILKYKKEEKTEIKTSMQKGNLKNDKKIESQSFLNMSKVTNKISEERNKNFQ